MALLYSTGSIAWQRLARPRLDAARMYRSQPQVKHEWTFTPREEGLDRERQGDHLLIPWSAFRGCLETDRYLFLVDHAGSVDVFPRAAFPTPAASQQFAVRCRELLESAPTAGTTPEAPTAAITFGDRRLAVRYHLSATELQSLRRQIIRRRVLEGLRGANQNPDAVIIAAGSLLVAFCVAWKLGPLAFVSLLALLAVVGWLAGRVWVQRRTAGCPNVIGEQEASVSPLGVSLAIPGAPLLLLGWPEVGELVRVPGFLLVVDRGDSAFGIPEAAFWDGTRADEFYRHAQDWHRENLPQR